MKRLYISFDDTDIPGTPGTGHVLAHFLETLPCPSEYISRHQLFVSPDVPYTSHNSAMCAAVTGDMDPRELITLAGAYLEATFTPGADPGLCVADPDAMLMPEQLVTWGYRSKKEVLAKADAYALALNCVVHLSEHGGNGQGVVGALAAVGLRIGGRDGRIRGRRPISVPVTEETMTVGELLRQTGFDRICAYGEGELPADARIRPCEDKVKAVLQDFRSTVLAVPDGGVYRLLGKEHLKNY